MKKRKLHQQLVESRNRIKEYDKILNEAEKTFRDLNSRNMIATLIQIEDFFDSNHLYAFNNWIEGVIWDGPDVSRHWIEITLQYPATLMPEPKGILRFHEMGVKYDFKKSTVLVPMKVKSPDDLDSMTRKPKEEEQDIWLVTLTIPRHLIEDPLPDDTQEVDTVQNIEATEEEGVEEGSEGAGEEIEEPATEGGEEGGEDLEL